MSSELLTRVVRPQKTGPWYDPQDAARLSEHDFPATVPSTLTTLVIDLSEEGTHGEAPLYATPSVLLEYLLPVAQRVQAFSQGRIKIVVSTRNRGTRLLVESVARQFQLPIFVSDSPEPRDVAQAEPLGQLTATESETLRIMARAGGRLTAAEFAQLIGMQPTAATNRLASLAKRGYLHRLPRSGRDGDLYVDPRGPQPERTVEEFLNKAQDAMPAGEYARTSRLLKKTLGDDYKASKRAEH